MQKRIKQAQKYLEWEEPNQAIAELRTVLKSNKVQKEYRWVPNHMMGIALSQKGEHASSARYLEKAIEFGSGQPETYHMLSVNYYNLGKFEEAEKYGKEAVERKEDFLKGWLNLGSVYRAKAKLDEALQCYQKANKLDPKNAGVAFRIGEIYRDQGDLEQALKLFDITLKIDKDHKRAILEKADIYKKKGSFKEAKKWLDEAREKHGKLTAILVNEAELYKSEGDYDKAINLYEKLLERKPGRGELRVNYALCLQEVSRFDESEQQYRKAIEETQYKKEAISNYLMGLHYNPKNNKEDIFEEHLRLGKKFIQKNKPEKTLPEDTVEDKRLKIGFVSGGFRRHPVGWMIAGALEQLPEDRFELYCYTTNNKYDFVTRRIHQNIDVWRSVVGYNDDIIDQLIREDELDILVDLSGHSADNCLSVMARKPAPVIVKWVGGLFNTTGLEAFDYLISDWHESPEGEEPYYIEKLVRLPDDYITFTPPAYAPEVGELPAEKNGYVTFGCFNNPTKVNEKVLKQWAGIMRKVPGSRLFLKSKQYDTPSFRDQITAVMEGQGISADLIEFQGHTTHDDHLQAYNKVDIALDPWPYSGGLTTCEALYMGVPVVTLPGPTFAGRHSTTHLKNTGLPQWVTDSWEEYAEKTVGLATNIDQLKVWRSSLRNQLLQSPVCDGKRFGAHLSVAFREMWKQRVDGYENGIEEWQDHIAVEPLSDVEIKHHTDGPKVTPLVTINNRTQIEQKIEENTPIKANGEDMNEKVLNTEKLAKGIQKHINGSRNGTAYERNEHEDYYVETKDGVTICTPADTNVLTTYVLLEQEEWFEPELDFLRQYVTSGMQVVDAGASFGAYALPMAKKVGGEGAVYAFEPGPVASRYLEMSKSENGFNQLEVIERGLAQETGKPRLKKTRSPEFNTIDEDGEENISVTTLDAWWDFAGQPDIDFVKIDVNGMESEVLRGGATTVGAVDPVILASIGENGESLALLREQLTEMDYVLFEYIPGPGLLAGHEPEAGVDPYLMNIVAIKENRINEFKEAGWIFDEKVISEQPENTLWMKTLSTLPWTDSLMDGWEEKVASGSHGEYLQALNMICAADQMEVNADDAQSRSRKGATMLAAAQKLIGLFNSGKAGISAAMTYVRIMNQLGKRAQAVEMMKELMETVNSGNEVQALLPFLPPLPEQDSAEIQTEFNKWLTVRIVEAWIILKAPSTYMSGEQEKQMLKVLEGNPEVKYELSKRILLNQIRHNQLSNKNDNKEYQLLVKSKYRNIHFLNQLYSQLIINRTFYKSDSQADLKTLMFITTDFPPYDGGRVGHSIRAYTLANFFARKGYKVYLVILQDLVQDREAPHMHENITILNFPFEEIKKTSNLNMSLKDFSIYCVEKLNIDVVLSSSPPLNSHVIAREIKLKYGDKIFWICDIRDIVSVHPATRRAGKENKRLQLLETMIMNTSDAVTTVSSGMEKTIFDIYRELHMPVVRNKFRIIENGYIEREQVSPQQEVVDFIKASRKEERIIIYYAGTGTLFGHQKIEKGNKDLTFLFDVLSKKPELRKHFSVIVQGKIMRNEQFLERINKDVKYTTLPPVSNEQMLSNLKLADIGLNVNVDRVQAPGIIGGKVYDYVFCGLGLLLIYPDNAYSLYQFSKKHKGKPFFADIYDEESIIQTLHDMVECKDSLDERKFTKEEVTQYNRYVQYKKFLHILKEDNDNGTELTELPSKEVHGTVTATDGSEFEIIIPNDELFRLQNIFRDEEYALPEHILLSKNGITVVDIGANVGSFALYASRWSDDYKIYCFEPNPQIISMLRRNTEYINSSLHPYALSDTNGTVKLWQHPQSTGGASITKSKKEGNVMEVPVRKSSEVFEELKIDTIDVLKIDTEGSEINILQSIKNRLCNVHVIMLEYHAEKDRRIIKDILSKFILVDENVARKDLGTLKFVNPNF